MYHHFLNSVTFFAQNVTTQSKGRGGGCYFNYSLCLETGTFLVLKLENLPSTNMESKLFADLKSYTALKLVFVYCLFSSKSKADTSLAQVEFYHVIAPNRCSKSKN